MGIALGLIGFTRGWFAVETVAPIAIATAVGASILAIVTLSTMVGSLLPLLIRRAGLDPAVSSTPFIASVVDVLGLVVYFAVAQVLALVFQLRTAREQGTEVPDRPNPYMPTDEEV